MPHRTNYFPHMTNPQSPHTVYFAKHIYLENGSILLNGAVSVHEGRIVDVAPRGKLKRFRDERMVNLGDTLLLPGFINMHTHLEEGAIAGFEKSAEETFASWANKKNSRLRQLTSQQIESAIRLRTREMLAQGTTMVADSSKTGLSQQILKDEPIRSVVIKEIMEEEQMPACQKQVQEWIQAEGCAKFGIGPHTLYSLPLREMRNTIEFTYDHGCLWACHLAESAEELQAFSEQKGDLFFHITRKKPWTYGETRLGSVNFAITENLIPSGGILFHCNYINGHELTLLAAKRASIVHCHRYAKNMGHKDFPLDVAMSRGIQLCLGTEGELGAGETSLFDELFALKMSYPHIPASEMIKWVTRNPASALKLSDSLGSISPGKYADIVGVRFPYDPDEDILESLIVSEPDISLVMIDGEEIIIGY